MAVETEEGVTGIGMGNVFGVMHPSTTEAIFVGVIMGDLFKDTVSLSLPSAENNDDKGDRGFLLCVDSVLGGLKGPSLSVKIQFLVDFKGPSLSALIQF
ncbi:hypothetical protein FXO38_26397 [Capsicum annuum]|nr:hypothetical protein FXO38_26397 [Capsicum annuum]